MTVEAEVVTAGPFSGNGVTVSFPYTFRIMTSAQIIVYETDNLGAVTTLTLTTHYTVTGVGVDGGGTVTRVAGPLPTGYKWYMRANYQPLQQTSFASQGGYFPSIHEQSLDHAFYLIQQLEDKISRAVRFGDEYSGALVAGVTLPNPDPGLAIVWNPAGDGFVNEDFVGPQGPQGIQGVPGNNGTNGTNGVDGTGAVITNVVVATTSAQAVLTTTPTLLQCTATGYGEVIKLPNPAAMAAGSSKFIADIRGDFPWRVTKYDGTLVGFLPPGRCYNINLNNISGAGTWSADGMERVGASAQLLTAAIGYPEVVLALDSDRDFILGTAGPSPYYTYAVVYKKSTNTFGAVTLIRSANVYQKQAAVKSATDQVLVVSSLTTAFEAVVLSISTTTITVNAAATATLSDNISAFADGCGLIQVGTSFITSYTVATPAAQIREITISGTTPTISAATVLDGTAGGLIVAGDSTHVIAVSTATTHLYTKPYTIGGLSAGTGTDTSTGFTVTLNKLTPLGSRWVAIYKYASSTYGGVISLSGTTTTITEAGSVGTLADAIVIGSTKVLLLFTDASNNANILTDSAGTASVGTAITLSSQTPRACLYVSGTDVAVQEGTTSYLVHMVDCSGASPVLTKTIANATISTTLTSAFSTSNAMLTRSANALYGTAYARTIVGNSGSQVFAAEVSGGVFNELPSKRATFCGTTNYRGTSDSNRWISDAATVITKVECVA